MHTNVILMHPFMCRKHSKGLNCSRNAEVREREKKKKRGGGEGSRENRKEREKKESALDFNVNLSCSPNCRDNKEEIRWVD